MRPASTTHSTTNQKSCATPLVAQVAQLPNMTLSSDNRVNTTIPSFESCATCATCATNQKQPVAKVAHLLLGSPTRAHTRPQPDLANTVPLVPRTPK